MKDYLILFVALSMLIKPLWPVAEYIMNYDYIVNVLCENKEKPQLNCDGKCYLSKQLAKESGQSEENPFGDKQAKTEIQHLVFFEEVSAIQWDIPFSASQQDNFKIVFLLNSSLFTSDNTEPPELV